MLALEFVKLGFSTSFDPLFLGADGRRFEVLELVLFVEVVFIITFRIGVCWRITMFVLCFWELVKVFLFLFDVFILLL